MEFKTTSELRHTTSTSLPYETETEILDNLAIFDIKNALNNNEYSAIIFAVSNMHLRINMGQQWEDLYERALSFLYTEKKAQLIKKIYIEAKSSPTLAHFHLALKHTPNYAADIVIPFADQIGEFKSELENIPLADAQKILAKMDESKKFEAIETVLKILAGSPNDTIRKWVSRQYLSTLETEPPTKYEIKPLTRVTVAPLSTIPKKTNLFASILRSEESFRAIKEIHKENKNILARRNTSEAETPRATRQLSPTRQTPRQLSPTRQTPRQLSPTRQTPHTSRTLSPTRQPQNTLTVPMQKYGKRAHVPKDKGKH